MLASHVRSFISTSLVRQGPGRLAAAVVFAALLGAPAAAHADDLPPEDWESAAPQRTFGFGTAFGGGFSAATSNSGSGSGTVGPALLFPTLELQGFFKKEYSLDITMPITNMIIVSNAVRGFLFNIDAFFNANVGKGTERLVIGPGLGFAVLSSSSGSAGTLRLPAQLGFELLSRKRGFGFKLLARPWAEFAFGTGGTAVGGGLLGALVFSGYSTSAPRASAATRSTSLPGPSL